MPQVPTEALLKIGKKMTDIGTKCCQLSEDRRMACSEGYVSTLVYFPYFSLRFLLFSKPLNSGEVVS